MNDVVTLYAYDWRIAESYGRVARELVDGLEALGVYVNCIGPHAPQKPIRMSVGGIALGYPTIGDQYGSLFMAGPRVWVTAFESTALPYGWATELNDAHAVIVPSRWLENIFQRAGVTTPVKAIPQGVSKAFQWVERVRSADDPYTFIAILDRGRRKAWHEAAFAFMRAFGDDLRYRLILKGRKDALSTPEGFPIRFSNPNIEMVTEDLTDAEMAALYARADCMIFPGREGFGLPPREFAGTGGTALALNWGGTADDLHAWGLPVAVAGMERAWPGHQTLDGVGEWAVPDREDMAATLKHVATHRDYYRERGRQASAFVTANYNWGDYARKVYAVWQEACDVYRSRQKRVS